jgi:hypothetical protein
LNLEEAIGEGMEENQQKKLTDTEIIWNLAMDKIGF